MKLKHKLTKEEFESLGESLQALYELKDGVYYAQVDGMVAKARLDEFRENNINLLEEKSKVEKVLKEFGDLTVESLAELREKAEKSGSGSKELTEEEKTALVESEVNKRITKMREENEKTVGDLNKKLSDSDSQLSTLVIDNSLSQEAIKAGIQESALPDVILRGRTVFKVSEGKAVPYKGDEIIYGKDGETPQSMGEWLSERADDSAHWFKPSGGSSSQQQQQSQKSSGAANTEVRGVNRMREART